MSPGGMTPYSLRRAPELPPSSAAVTTAVIRSRAARWRRNAVSTTGSPVPPPMATTFTSVLPCDAPRASRRGRGRCRQRRPAWDAADGRGQRREVDARHLNDRVLQGEARRAERVGQGGPALAEREIARDRRAPKIHVHQEHAGLLGLRQRAGQIDGGHALAVADAGARDG